MQMNLIYFTHNYLCLWVEEIKHSSLKPSTLSDSRRISRAFVYNRIHVGYFEDDVQRGYHGDTTDTNKQKTPAQNKNVNLIRFIWPIAGLCPRLEDYVRWLA